jgi:hypothetical protein
LHHSSRREDANKLSGSRGSYCFDLDGNEDPADAPDEKNSQPSYSVDALAAGKIFPASQIPPDRTPRELDPICEVKSFVLHSGLLLIMRSHCCSPNLQVIPVVFDAMPQVRHISPNLIPELSDVVPRTICHITPSWRCEILPHSKN